MSFPSRSFQMETHHNEDDHELPQPQINPCNPNLHTSPLTHNSGPIFVPTKNYSAIPSPSSSASALPATDAIFVEKEHMFDKVVTPSDVGKLNRLVIPKQHAEKYFPLDMTAKEKGLLLSFEDRTGKPWRFRYSYWNSCQSYVMTKGWSRFVKEKRLVAGDTVSFCRGVGEAGRGRLFIDWRCHPDPPLQQYPPRMFTHHNMSTNRSKAKQLERYFDTLENEGLVAHNKKLQSELGETIESSQRSSPVGDSPVYGRENEKNSIIGFLLSDDFNRSNLSVVCIVGESGIGKTSLAHLIYSEERVLDSFDARMFITMPEKSDETRLIKKFIESVTSSPCPMTEADLLEELLIDELSGTKVFVVLDDADNENPCFWNKIVTILNHSTRGSVLLVTTKSKDIAEVIGAMQTFNLDPLSDYYCWKIFWQHIFTGLNTNANTDLVETGKQLVSRCQHNPLCIKVLAGLLVCLKNVESWVEILKTELWNMDGFDGDTLPILRVCYETLPDNLKKCLHYCSLFPKDYVFAKQQIVRMWMSQGFIVSVEGRQPEDVGLQNFDELLLRGFFQHSALHDVEEDKYIMHDLIRALATHFSRNECSSAEDAVESILENCFHFSLNPSVIRVDKMKPLIKEASDLQSFLVLRRLQTRINISILDSTSLSDLFTKCINLRTLDLSCTDIVELPGSVGMLKQLRYLGVNNTKIRSIPRELCSLVNLQTLEAKDCQHLVELPESMMELTNLRHLDVSKKSGCVKMMIGIGQLTNLQSLAVFCVGCEMPYCSIRELKDLNCLSSCLQIAGLENIRYGLDAKEAALHNKVHLNTLWLHWNDNTTCIDSEESVTISEEVLKNLKPNPNIGELIIRNYKGNLFPIWMGDPSFSKLVSIILDKCLNCSQFPALGRLPSLRHLSVQKLYHLVRLENTDSQFVSKNTPKFPSLETLNLWEMYDLEELFETSDCDFPHLRTLSISRCPMLKSVPCFSSLLNLSLYCCVKLPYLPDFPSLKSFRIDGFKKIKSLELPKDLPALKELDIRHCNELLLVEGLPKLPSLERLNVVHCPKFDPFNSWKPCHSKSISTTRWFFPKEEPTTQVEHQETSNLAEMLIADDTYKGIETHVVLPNRYNPDYLFAPEVINSSRMNCLSDLSRTDESMLGHSVSKREREPSDEDTSDKQPKADKQLKVTKRICAGCKTPIGPGRFLSCMDSVWHPDCFCCDACDKPISDFEFSMHEDHPYHKNCYRELYHPKCDVCKDFIPTNKNGLIEYRAHPFWMQKYCPSHEDDDTPSWCCSCERLERKDVKYITLDDGRKLCLECLNSAIMDNSECQPLYIDIQEFYEGLNMKVEQQVPLLLVERQALNEAMEGEKMGHHHLPETRGLCLSNEQIVRTILRRPVIGPGNKIIDMVTGNHRLVRRCEVTAILILFGLPRLLTGSILAHEMMHAWLRLKGFRSLSPEVEEGICQVLAHMWLESEITSGSSSTTITHTASTSASASASASASTSSSLTSSKKGPKSDFEKKLGEFFKNQIETDTSAAYGEGFRVGNKAVTKYGLRTTLEHIKLTGSFPY